LQLGELAARHERVERRLLQCDADPVDGLQAALELPLQADDLDRNNARKLLHAQLVARPHATTTPCSC
jgi:hypothetical protein